MISIIVPVFNVEHYLKRCINSILNQTYKNFELILVDDGSTDDSGKICDDFAKHNSNIKVFHKKNGGLSSARNAGIENSKGEYITFIDSDDFISNTYLETLYNLIIKYNAEISCCNFQFFYNESEIKYNNDSGLEECFDSQKALENMLYGKIHGSSACAMLLKRNIVESYKFPFGKYHEDDFVTFLYYASATKVAITSKEMYYYYQRTGSIMHRPFGQSALDELEAADFIVKNCNNMNKNIQKASLAKQFFNYRDVLFAYKDLKTNFFETYKKVTSTIRHLKFNIIRDKNVSKRSRVSALCLILFGIKMSIFIHDKFKI